LEADEIRRAVWDQKEADSTMEIFNWLLMDGAIEL
jgi:hypothetical protein